MGVNLSGTEAKRGGSVLPEGTYTAVIDDAYDVIANSGTEGLGLNLEVTVGDQKGGRISHTLWLTEKSLPYSKYAIEAAGGAIPDGEFEVSKDDPGFARMCRSMVGARVKIVVRNEKDRNDPTKEWPRVQSVEKADGAQAGNAGGSGGGASRRDDDIPFAASRI